MSDSDVRLETDDAFATSGAETHEERIVRAAKSIDIAACLDITAFSDDELLAALTRQ